MAQTEKRASINWIFCQTPSHASKSVEHIIPESLGNSKHFLAAGIVCDRCNNYFAVKIERPLLETTHFRNLRSRQGLANKRGKVPYSHGLLLGVNREIQVDLNPSHIQLGAIYKKDEPAIYDYLIQRKTGTFIIPFSSTLDQYVLSRFLSKVALEMVAYLFGHIQGWEIEIARPEFNLIRNYARYGTHVKYWPFHQREIYDENRCINEEEKLYQTLHEFDLLYTKQGQMYAVICILGTEYTINLVGPNIDGYEHWLKENLFKSYLYVDKKKLYGDMSEYPILAND